MHAEPQPATTSRPSNNAFRAGRFSPAGIKRIAHLAFISGPRRFFSSHMSSRSATFIMLLCAPPILLFLATTVPTIIFPSPEQEAYFYFASTFSQDLSTGFNLGLAALCMCIAFALPAAIPDPYTAVRR